LAKLLVGYYGLIEAAHIVVLVWAGINLARTGVIGFPAAPPPEGWSPQVPPFLVATAVADAVNVALAWLFVYGYFARAHWRWWVGGITLTAAVYSAIVFAWGTIASGAWGYRPVGYLSMAVAFVPVAALVLSYSLWGVGGWFAREEA
jgi:hypothetical protein